ncbi:hypothetical protein B0H15DRAFT_844604 [Mycena belliarum]|uniref:Uncharacterized protein n=1 Tax=Mycena belliarum TaxID=1033014 RepID=A0AAD6U1M7_9AGAR|nr:hypothetical protein B0H15DRAFT_844604 [Mycena belliae]
MRLPLCGYRAGERLRSVSSPRVPASRVLLLPASFGARADDARADARALGFDSRCRCELRTRRRRERAGGGGRAFVRIERAHRANAAARPRRWASSRAGRESERGACARGLVLAPCAANAAAAAWGTLRRMSRRERACLRRTYPWSGSVRSKHSGWSSSLSLGAGLDAGSAVESTRFGQ